MPLYQTQGGRARKKSVPVLRKIIVVILPEGIEKLLMIAAGCVNRVDFFNLCLPAGRNAVGTGDQLRKIAFVQLRITERGKGDPLSVPAVVVPVIILPLVRVVVQDGVIIGNGKLAALPVLPDDDLDFPDQIQLPDALRDPGHSSCGFRPHSGHTGLRESHLPR